jgi:hypothetical protein
MHIFIDRVNHFIKILGQMVAFSMVFLVDLSLTHSYIQRDRQTLHFSHGFQAVRGVFSIKVKFYEKHPLSRSLCNSDVFMVGPEGSG